MDNDSIQTSNDETGLISGEMQKEAMQTFAGIPSHLDDLASVNAHRSCPNLSLSLSLESFIRNFERERTNTVKQGAETIHGVPLCSANLLLPTPKVTLDASLMSRICKSMNNIDALCDTKKPHFLLDKPQAANVTEEEFFELIERLNANRLQDQRADFPPPDENKEGDDKTLNASADHNTQALMEIISEMQSRRYDDQRASPVLTNYEAKEILRRLSLRTPNEQKNKVMDEQLYELIMTYQGSRLEEQRGELGGRKAENSKSGKLEKKDSKKKAKKTYSSSAK